MKKLIYSTFALGLVLSLSSFSSVNANKVSINELNSNDELVLLNEVGSFVEAEESHYGGDKSTWSKRKKTWTEFSQSEDNLIIENIINRN